MPWDVAGAFAGPLAGSLWCEGGSADVETNWSGRGCIDRGTGLAVVAILDAWAGLFAANGSFTEVGVFTVTGYPALVAKCEASNADATTHFHAQVNTMLVQTDNRHVEGLTNLLYGTLSTATAPAALVGYGDYVDLFVRTPDGWRFQSRSASTHKAQGLPPAFLNGA
jgi:hypothetical protein